MLTGLFTQLGLIQPYVKTGATSDARPSLLAVSLLLAKPERTEKRNHQIAQTSRQVPKHKPHTEAPNVSNPAGLILQVDQAIIGAFDLTRALVEWVCMCFYLCVCVCGCQRTKPPGQYIHKVWAQVFPCAFVDVNHHGKVFCNMASSLPLRKLGSGNQDQVLVRPFATSCFVGADFADLTAIQSGSLDSIR